ncbi:MAG TPA: hypothetical protein VGD76_04580 [Ramlibacter sp.]
MALPARWLLAAAATAAAVGVFLAGMSVHLRSACTERDTPYLPLCPEPTKEAEALRGQMRERIARNPGDSVAWTRLLVAVPREHSATVLTGAALVAPMDPMVARWRAAQALQNGRLPEGIALLVQILENRHSAESARVLAQIAATSDGLAYLRPHLAQGGKWLPQVLGASHAMKLPPGNVLPLVAEAVKKGALVDDARHLYMRSLKAGGHWLDAYGLWLAQHKDPVPLLYNGGFDQAMEPDGFDWEFTRVPRSRAGVMVEQDAVARRGLVLGLEFTGRSFTAPLVRQYLFASPGTYRLRGEYMASKLRSESGLTWSVLCTSGRKAVLARSRPLQETGGVWKPFEVDFTVPPDCGAVASLQLETAAQYEAATGIKGRVAFDAFSLARMAN